MSNAVAAETSDIVFGLDAAPGRLLAARLSGLYQSLDGGRHWQPLFQSLAQPTPPPANSVAAAPVPGLLFAGAPGGVLRSTDDGATWELHALARPPAQVSAIQVSPAFAVDGTVFAGTVEDGVCVSTDQGRQWQAWNIGLFERLILGLAVSPHYAADRTVFAATNTGLYLSRNGGRLWQALDLPGGGQAVTAVAMAPAASVVAAGTEAGDLLLSTDAGRSWQAVPLPHTPDSVQGLEFAEGALYALTGQALLRVVETAAGWRSTLVHSFKEAAPACLKLIPAAAGGLAVLIGDVAGKVYPVTLTR